MLYDIFFNGNYVNDKKVKFAGVAELADALVLGTSGETRGSSSLSTCTIYLREFRPIIPLLVSLMIFHGF